MLLSTLPWKLDYEPLEKFAVSALVLSQSELCQKNEQSMTVNDRTSITREKVVVSFTLFSVGKFCVLKTLKLTPSSI